MRFPSSPYRALLFCVLTTLAYTSVGCGHGSQSTAPRNPNGGVDVPPIPEPTYVRWSDPSSWPTGRKPAAGEDVTIPAGLAILLDETPPALGGITINGTLGFDDTADRSLSAKWIMVHGRLRVGTPAAPFTHHAEITLTDTDTNVDPDGMGTRGILLMGGILELVGVTPVPAWTHLGANAAAGATSLTLAETTNWQPGDAIAVAPTTRYATGHTERLTLASASGTSIGLSAGLAKARYGKTQSFGGTTLDERAEVANLTRNIVIHAPDDAVWQSQGFGAHVMVMRGALARIDGVQFERVGQAGRLGRYPVHFHRMSYADDGSDLGDTPSYVRNIAVSGSRNRCITVHATNGVKLENNVCHDIRGHAIFLEDAVERRTTIEWNLALAVRNPASGQILLAHEGPVFEGGSSGFWITNPDNTLRHNVAADCQGNGFWYALPEHSIGASTAVSLRPAYMPFGLFEDNVAHTNQQFGLMFDFVPVDNAGNTTPFKYQPFKNGTPTGSWSDRLRVGLDRLTTYKNDLGGLWNRAEQIDMRGFVVADNVGTAFSGGSTNCSISDALIVGHSDNDEPLPSGAAPTVGVATYHSECDIVGNTFVNLPFVAGQPSGAFKTDDYYMRPVDRGMRRNVDNHLTNTHPGFRSPMPGSTEHYALAGALWDPEGHWGPAGSYWVYDTPFLTTGTTCQWVDPMGQNGRSCVGPYYGALGFSVDGSDNYMPMMPIEVTRQDAGNAVFSIGDGNTAPKLGWMRHFAMVKGGTYALRFPGVSLPQTNLLITLHNLNAASDYVVLGVPFDGTKNARAYFTTDNDPNGIDGVSAGSARAARIRRLTAASSVAEVASASAGDRFYQDKANNLVWVRPQGGLPPDGTVTAGTDTDLYHPMVLRVTTP